MIKGKREANIAGELDETAKGAEDGPREAAHLDGYHIDNLFALSLNLIRVDGYPRGVVQYRAAEGLLLVDNPRPLERRETRILKGLLLRRLRFLGYE